MMDVIKFVFMRCERIAVSVVGGFFLAIEATTVNFFVPCLLAIILDIFSAVELSKRVKRKYPNAQLEGKFKSSHKFRVLKKIMYVFTALILAHYVDGFINGGEELKAQIFTLGTFLFYECISILENFSSENPSRFATALQRVLINKAERYTATDLKDIFENKKDKENETKQ